ncbi:hypothetical protein JY197_004476 [Salmonella enterica subsp. enterica serovar Oranienburg]|nr:hypothetical protein [Salmonella enterica subsp. enterica serovar Oranienburg]
MQMSRPELDGWLAALNVVHRPPGRGRKGGRHTDDTPDTPPQKTFKSQRKKRSAR